MKANAAHLLDFLRKSHQFAVPIYQRTYCWKEKECRQLWDDIIRTGSNDAISAHFIGSIVYIEKSQSQVTNQTPLLVIDGQQRLTTISLLIAALAKAVGTENPLEGFSAKQLRFYYLMNDLEREERRYKLLLSQTDKASLIAIVSDDVLPTEQSLHVKQSYEFFTQWLTECNNDYTVLCNGLAKLMVVDIALERDHDNPQLIFESMNSTGKELSQADLIRNFILMGLEPAIQTRLYEQYWRPMEVDFGQAAYITHFDAFMRHYLTVKTGAIPNVDQVYEVFKAFSRQPDIAQAGVEALIKDIRDYSRYFCAMALGTETHPELKAAFHDLRELKVDVAYPFLLELYHDYTTSLLSADDYVAAVRLVEAYVFRRAICAIPPNSMNKTFARFSKAINKNRYLESIQAQFLTLPSYRRFPTDDEFKRDIQTRDLYNFRNCSYWLRRLENHGRKERVAVDQYTIEHIMPQNEDVPPAWRAALGPDWQRIHETYLHTLGNLTLTGYNSEYSDHTFPEKRDMTGGFKESPLKLNAGLGQLQHWNESEIQSRAIRLAELALTVWTAPRLESAVLATYKPKTPATTTYTVDDHPHLLSPTIQPLFDALRKAVKALDPVVNEEFLKLYVAYKAETNFLDVIPKAKRLLCSINVPFAELDDPKGLCRDVTGLGRWGNGYAEIHLENLEDLPYIMGLVRQAFERQMGNGEQ